MKVLLSLQGNSSITGAEVQKQMQRKVTLKHPIQYTLRATTINKMKHE